MSYSFFLHTRSENVNSLYPRQCNNTQESVFWAVQSLHSKPYKHLLGLCCGSVTSTEYLDAPDVHRNRDMTAGEEQPA